MTGSPWGDNVGEKKGEPRSRGGGLLVGELGNSSEQKHLRFSIC